MLLWWFLFNEFEGVWYASDLKGGDIFGLFKRDSFDNSLVDVRFIINRSSEINLHSMEGKGKEVNALEDVAWLTNGFGG